MTGKESNFISAVIYLRNDSLQAVEFLRQLNEVFEEHFDKYELIAVNNASTDDTVTLVHNWTRTISHPLTLVNMSLRQTREVCMNAGLDAAIGDYVYEFDQAEMNYTPELIFAAYQRATGGSDIVSVCPDTMSMSSRLFYSIFNSNSHSSYKLCSAAFRILSRRAINRVHATSQYLPYRKAAYAASGLKQTNIMFDGTVKKEDGRFSLAVDSLILYTEAGVKISFGITIVMLLAALFGLAYAVVIYFTGHPIEGWTTTMIIMTFGFAGVFCIFTIVIKYLSLILDLVFRKQKYFIESIEKIQK